ncbi:putative dna-directed rna polymerase iii subunit rpc34 protein [Lasiodiplodia theobromae]|uniref:DNA-directed RNA polymerase III subunit RPC6 n=2 Tax=Lasiodiplodia TaxID=66739 RepID=A0A5N5DA70_9PEZI|nr:DNA-directed RNA polymerase iii subunit Rpc6 [Lasiodiplodia theobromae]KAB2574541.1 DNA-directed RNA polymerase III subunit RPC6 [Lasiodiplodia theobromae]KAF4537905.1 DNA-directed RNA polymerase iii subunit Rpc6 [Lasiodiplodia theobromae]KAF9635578.1 putative dna-directed rna polymerase iii subunit rpc34 protein [Lasiodiplodia theobromae]KAK0664869.1 DNA-directed RNA polymerase III subunit RPC6 [Lasiodiplodia hormozganensis]
MSKKDQLYDKCAERPPGTIFFQEDLSLFNIAKDVEELVRICQELVDSHLFELLEKGHNNWDRVLCWRLRSREDAAKLRGMDPNERLVYSHISSAEDQGMWTRTIKAKTNFHQTVINKALKSLEGKRLVKSITSVKHPGRKIYMLAHLTPSEEVSGGPWHTDGELDIELIEQISTVILNYVEQNSWVEQKPHHVSKADIKRKKEQAQRSASNAVPEAPKYRPALGRSGGLLLPHPPGYRNYPTASSILEFIEKSGVIEGVVIREMDLRSLLDNMVFDGKIERMGAMGYRSVRGAMEAANDAELAEGYGNGLTQAPCGRCPVFNLCEEGGPVSASNCEYFEEWLKVAS